MYESLSLTQTTIVCAEVTGFIEQKLRFSKDYLFIVEILWTDKRTTYVKRSYGDFFQFYQDIKYHFDDKWLKGILRTPVYIPQINGKYERRLMWTSNSDSRDKTQLMFFFCFFFFCFFFLSSQLVLAVTSIVCIKKSHI